MSNSIANTKGDIDVNDNSYLWDIIQNPKDSTGKKFNYGNKFSAGNSIKERYHSSINNNQKYPITYFIYKVVVYLFKLIICCFYRVATYVRQLFISDKGNQNRAADVSTSPRFNFIVFVAFIVSYIVLIVIILSFFIKSVLFFRPDTRINESGAITMPQSCERENYMYLLNSATYWGNSSIKVLKGDEVSITVSGSFFSKIGEMHYSALNNKLPKYDRTFVSFDKNKKQQSDTSENNKLIEFCRKFVSLFKNSEQLSDTSEHNKLLVANLKYPNRHVNDKFGSLLIQIRDNSDHTLFHLGDIISDTASTSSDDVFHFKAKKSGYLHFAVNDEYITKSWFEDSIKPNPEVQRKLDINNFAKLPDTLFMRLKSLIKADKDTALMNNEYGGNVYLNKTCFDLIKKNKKYQESIGWTDTIIDTLTVWDKWDEKIATMWYSDNVGDILISVRIKRQTVHGNILEPTVLSKTYREIEDFFLYPPFGRRKIILLICILLIVVGWMAFDHKYGEKVLKWMKNKLSNRFKRILS